MLKTLILAVLIGQPLAAPSLQASVITPMKEALVSNYKESIRLESVYVHKRMLAPFANCQDIKVSLTHGRQRLNRPRFEVSCRDSGVKRRIVAKAEGEFRSITPVRDIPRGRLLIGSDIDINWLSFSEHRHDILMEKKKAYGREVRIPIRKGRVLRDSHLSPRYDIFSGQITDLVVSRSGIYFSIPVEAKENGVRGDEIKVKNISSGETFHVMITEQGSLSL